MNKSGQISSQQELTPAASHSKNLSSQTAKKQESQIGTAYTANAEFQTPLQIQTPQQQPPQSIITRKKKKRNPLMSEIENISGLIEPFTVNHPKSNHQHGPKQQIGITVLNPLSLTIDPSSTHLINKYCILKSKPNFMRQADDKKHIFDIQKWDQRVPGMNDKSYHIFSINNSHNDEKKMTMKQEANVQRSSLVNLFSQRVKQIKHGYENVDVVEFGNEIGDMVKCQLKPFGPLVSKESYGGQTTSRNQKDNYMLGAFSEGEDSEIEIELQDHFGPQPIKQQFNQINKMKDRIVDDMDKMGPRERHCVNSFVQSQYLKEITPEMDEQNLKTYVMIKNLQDMNSSLAGDFKKIQMRIKVRFQSLHQDFQDYENDLKKQEVSKQPSEEGELPQDKFDDRPSTQITGDFDQQQNFEQMFDTDSNFRQLLPSSSIYLPDTNSLLLSYNDHRIEELVTAILQANQQDQQEEISRVYDVRTSPDSTWVGIILRHIPASQTQPEAVQIMDSFNNGLKNVHGKRFEVVKIEQKDVLKPITIQGKLCTQIDIRGGIEHAEQICKDWNQKFIPDRKEIMKCHIHPYSCRKRQFDSSSIDTTQPQFMIHPYHQSIWNHDIRQDLIDTLKTKQCDNKRQSKQMQKQQEKQEQIQNR